MRLLRSHAGGVGDPLPDELVQATLLIRLAQIAAGGGGHRPEIADALAAVLRDGPLPVLRDLGGIGTGDLTLLAQLGLALAGEGEWASRAERPSQPGASVRRRRCASTIEAGDALALMSSNAATHAAAALAWADARELLDAGLGIAALTFHALDGNREAFAPQLAAARPLPGLAAVSERLRVLTDGAPAPARMQDPFGLRCLPPVAGALHDAARALHDVLAVEINAAAENPLIAGGEVLHHGGFHAASVALALDTLRLALVPFASMSAARLVAPDGARAQRPAAVPVGRRARQLGHADRRVPRRRRAGAAARRRRAGRARHASRSRAGSRSTPASPGRRPAWRATPCCTCAPCWRSSGSRPSARCG